MAKKIKITEQQLKSLIVEQQYDEAMIKYDKERNKDITMTQDEAIFLLNFGTQWCEGRSDHRDCEEVRRIRAKLKLYV